MTPAIGSHPDGVEALLSSLAAIWVERWLAYGGGLIVDAGCDNLHISMRLDWRRRNVKPTPTTSTHLWHDGWMVGRWRELNDLARLIPGLSAAIIHHVALHGRHGPEGRAFMAHS